MNTSIELQSLDLSNHVVRHYLPVSKEHRRLHVRLFPGLDAEIYKVDDKFYAYLTDLLKGDLSPILKFDRAMKRENKLEKQFSKRAVKALAPHLEHAETFEEHLESLDAKAADELAAPEIRQLARFLLRLVKADIAPQGGDLTESDIPQHAIAQADLAPQQGAEPSAQDWTTVVADMAELLALSEEPDVELAQLLLERAEVLLSCAQRHADKARAIDRLAKRLAALLAGFDECLSPEEQAEVRLPAVLPDAADPVALESLLEACERTTRSLAEAERHAVELKLASAQAHEADDLEQLVVLTHKRAEAKQQRTAVLAERAEVLAALAMSL